MCIFKAFFQMESNHSLYFLTHIVNSSSEGPLEESLALAVMLTLATVP